MAVLRFPPHDQVIENESEVRSALGGVGIEFEHWDLSRVAADAPAEAVLAAYGEEIDELKRRGGYRTADIIDVHPETPGLDAMLARFDKEHTHWEDEVRFILAGRGVFFLHLSDQGNDTVVSVEVHPGDLLRVPKGTTHWFTLCEDKRIRAIRWFQDTTGWTPHYTGTGVDKQHQPLCFGPAYFGPRVASTLSV
ncbi:MAG: cupin domain-containing protein [Terracidiphilus sp.]|jgi:1,2-dihydroxy-3-keto-5-methylthiopentene dioxygenase